VIATGPGHGIELTNGRLLVPVWLSTGGKRHRPSCVSVIYSDDHGTSWHRGEIVCGHPEPLVNPSETLAVELSDGRVMLNIRNENKDFRRAISFSADGARRWSKPRFDDQLFDPICMGSLIRLRRQQPGRLLFANPDSASVHRKTKSRYGFRTRENLTVRLSRDDGKSWPVSRVIDSGVSGYSDLAEAADGSVYCLYERGGEEGFAFEHLTLVHFDLDWLTTDP
jgi:sialidase-1